MRKEKRKLRADMLKDVRSFLRLHPTQKLRYNLKTIKDERITRELVF